MEGENIFKKVGNKRKKNDNTEERELKEGRRDRRRRVKIILMLDMKGEQ